MRPTEVFAKEHQIVRRALAVLEEMANRAERGDMPDRHDINALLIFLHYFVDECHQGKEESVFFPAIRRCLAASGINPAMRSGMDGLLQGHTHDRSLIEDTQRHLFSDRPLDFVGSARKLIHLLSAHSAHEEQVFFPMAEQFLSREQADEIVMAMEQADADFGHSQLALLTRMLEELENKYLKKVA